MNINFNVPFKNLKGESIEGGPLLSATLSDLLSTETKGNALKLYGWATKLAKGEVLELDKPDFDTLKALIESTDRVIVLVKGQLLEILRDAEKAAA